MLKVNNKNTNQNNISDIVLVFLLLTMNIFPTFFLCLYYCLEQVNVNWVLHVDNNDNFVHIYTRIAKRNL